MEDVELFVQDEELVPSIYHVSLSRVSLHFSRSYSHKSSNLSLNRYTILTESM